jgi:hypothetical protein
LIIFYDYIANIHQTVINFPLWRHTCLRKCLPTGIGREATIIKDLHFFVLSAWFFIVVYLLLFLFYPLGKGFLLSHQLWLRFTNCKPHEVALSRVIWVVGYAKKLGKP